jgi:hypothetical protein
MKKSLLSLTLLLFISCNRLESGVIIQKETEPERVYQTLQHIQIGKVATYIPITHFDDEDYKITVHGSINEKEVTEVYYIPESNYDTLKLGDVVCLKGWSKKPNNDTKINNHDNN